MRSVWILLCLLSSVLVVRAQDGGMQNLLSYGQDVSGVLENDQFFDLWTFQGRAGEPVSIRMIASEGLEPLIGLLDPAGELIASSEEGASNATVSLTFTLERDGLYSIVATRAGRDAGTSSGSYSLLLDLAAPIPTRPPSREVTFRCGTDEIASALALEIPTEMVTPDIPYRITVIGLDTFQPYVRITAPAGNLNYCRPANAEVAGGSVALPNGESIALNETLLSQVFDLEISNPDLNGLMTLTVGSRDAQPGRYMLVLTGFGIENAGQVERLGIRIGPLAAPNGAQMYMLAETELGSRLDPYMRFQANGESCDDAGRRGCMQVASFLGAGLRRPDGSAILGTRFSAGLALQPANLEQQVVELGSFSGNTFGRYALVVIGELPARLP